MPRRCGFEWRRIVAGVGPSSRTCCPWCANGRASDGYREADCAPEDDNSANNEPKQSHGEFFQRSEAFHTTVPKSRPTAAVPAIASAPQNATRIDAFCTGAPPVRADTAPSAVRHTTRASLEIGRCRSGRRSPEHVARSRKTRWPRSGRAVFQPVALLTVALQRTARSNVPSAR